MIERGTVVVVTDDEIQIMMGGAAACNGCTACSVGQGGARILKLSRQVECKPGDQVEIEVNPASPYITYLTYFVLPLLVMFLFYVILKNILPDHLLAKNFLVTGGTLVGLIGAIPFIKMVDRYFRKNENKFIRIKQVHRMEFGK